jgi:hypothetical protein
MPNDTIQSDIFKFVALRPPVSVEEKNKQVNFISDDRDERETPVTRLVLSFNNEEGTDITEKIKDLINRKEYALDFPQGDDASDFKRIKDFLNGLHEDEISKTTLVQGIENMLDSDVESFWRSNEVQKLWHGLWDRYYAFYLLGRTEPQNLESLTNNLRIFHLIYLLSENVPIDAITYKNIFAAKPLVPKIFSELTKPKVTQQETPEPPPQKVQEYKELWADLVNTNRAIDEIKNLKFDTKSTVETRAMKTPNMQTGREDTSNLSLFKNSLVVSPSSFQSLHASTKSLLQSANISAETLQVPNTLMQLQNNLGRTMQTMSQVNDLQFLSHMPAEAKFIPGVAGIVGKFDRDIDFRPLFPVAPPTNVRASIKPLGVGDLKVVKQKLKKYVAGEVAHIENVLRGEYKERKHRVLDRTEDIITTSNETEEETTKDTQTTDRFELKKESEKTVQEQMSLQAGVTVSASYGPVTFGAHGDFAYSTASQESNKSSSNFAREVIDKSISRIQKKTKEERVTKKLHEVEEINTHGIDNKGKPDHISGIYRWVDKYYEAQIYNYGKRMMFEFIIPEPSAFYEYAISKKSESNITGPQKFELTSHKQINETNYDQYISRYNVQGVVTPPIPFKTVSISITKDGLTEGKTTAVNSKELIVPQGYFSRFGVWFDCSAYWVNHPRLEITIGNKIFRLLENSGATGAADGNFNRADINWAIFTESNPIQVSINTYDILSYTLQAYVYCERNWEHYEQWQIQTFEKIMASYKALQAEYEQKLAAQQTQQGVVIKGQNPAINRAIEKTELKKSCIKMLMDTYQFGTFDAMKQSAGGVPDFDIFDALSEGSTIQFFEQAFEWENLTYLFYPYFWGRNSKWVSKMNTYDTDPLFTQFLQAGSARVVLPVHPGYNDAVMYYLENNGALWKGGEAPRLNDPMFLSIADELRSQTDDLFGATPEGDPWEVVLPTTLVYLQQDSVLPDFTQS